MAVSIRRMAWMTGAVFALVGSAAWAGGDDYDATTELSEDKGPSYFGFVKDARGVPVSEARVVLKGKDGKGVEVKTNVLGLYRTHVSKEATPAEVELSCNKDGYRQVRVFKRSAPADARVIEIDCTLQRL